MIVLALDSTTRAGSVAVVNDRQIVCELAGDPTLTHGQRLPGELKEALRAASLTLADIDLLAVASGPGSFTGLRVGIAAMQGLAIATGRRIVPVSALDALAYAAGPAPDRRPIGVWMDAQRGQVFAALYDSNARRVRIQASADRPDATLDAWSQLTASQPPRFIGDGAVRYAETIRGQLGPDTRIETPPPLGGIIGLIAGGSPDRAVLPHAVVPVYIRRPDAELARLERARESGR